MICIHHWQFVAIAWCGSFPIMELRTCKCGAKHYRPWKVLV